MSKLYDIIGKKFGKLTVLERLPNEKNRQSVWLCQCDCGNLKKTKGHFLVNGKVKSCGCLRRDINYRTWNFTGCGDISGKYWYGLQRGSKIRNIEFNIAIENAWALFQKQNGKCAISGIPIELQIKFYGSGTSIQTASLDRIDSTKGYIDGNIQWVHKDVQKMKNDFSEDQFIFLCHKIAETKNGTNK